MNKFIVACLLLTLNAFGGLPPTTLKGQSGSNVTTFNFQVPHSQATQVSGPTSLIETGNQNILQNPGFEGTGDWTASGGATTAINTTAVGTGSKGYDWDSNSASQTLSSDSVTIPNGLKGKNGVVSCAIKTVSGTSTHTIQAYDGTNIIASTSITSDTGSFARTSLNFVFPTSGSAVLRLVSVASNEPEIYIDDCYMGLAEGFNIGSISQYGDWTTYGSASSWVGLGSPTSNYLEYRTAPQGMEIRFKVTSGTSTGVPLTLALPSSCTTASNYASNEMAGPSVITTTTGRTWTPLVSASATTISFGDVATANAFTARNGSSLISSGEVAAGQFFVRCQGFSSNTVYRPELSNVWGSTYWPDGTASFTTTSASYTAVTAASMLGTAVRTGRAVACADTNAICIEIPSMPAGSYKVEYSGGIIGDSGTSCAISAYDGTTDYEMSGTNGGGTIIGHTVITYSSQQTDKEFTIRIKRTSGVNNCQVATSLALGHNITITPLDQQMPAPIIVDRESVVYQDQKASGTAGGTCTSGSYATRVINTLSNPSGATWAGTPSSNQFTLTAGTYRVNGYATGSSVGLHKAKLYNVTDAADTVIGTSEQTVTASVDTGASKIQGVFTISGTKTFEVRHRCSVTNADDGFGVANSYGDVEVYTSLEFEKIR